MTEPMTPETADALAAVNAATHKRGWDAGYAAGFVAGATAQKEMMDKAAKEKPEPKSPVGPSQIILVDEGGIERVLDAMEHPDA